MPEVNIDIGGRSFEVACQDGEEHFLQSAANLLDAEAQVINSQIGRMPESRMLLMSGLMLADKTAGLEEQLRQLTDKLAKQEALIEELRSAPAAPPEKVEVPVVPDSVSRAMAELAARAEAVADRFDEVAPN